MENKDKQNKRKSSQVILMQSIAVFVVCVITVSVFAVDWKKLVDKKEEPKVVSVEKAPNLYYEQNISFNTLKKTLDDNVKKEGSKEELQQLVEAFITGTQVNASNYTEVLNTMTPDILAIEAENKEIDVYKNKNIDLISNKMVKGFVENLEDQMLKIEEVSDSESEVVVDYEKIKETYADHFNGFIKNVVNYEISLQKTSLVNERNMLNINNVAKLVSEISKVEDGEISKDQYYWELHRYQLYTQMLGLGVEGVNLDDGEKQTINPDFVKEFEAAIANEENASYKEILEKVLVSIKAEGYYGPKTTEVANKIMNETFSEYIKYIEEEQKRSSKTE